MLVAIYACLFALAFYHIEAPHEEAVREAGIHNINAIREAFLAKLWRLGPKGSHSQRRGNWTSQANRELDALSRRLFHAFAEEFIIYEDVRRLGALPGPNGTSAIPPRESRHLWTHSSAIFFAATTMATIGYGNIVPVTNGGRVLCIFFALFGAPLAIITIGDLGKFLSECTIWLYKKLRLIRERLPCGSAGSEAGGESGAVGDSKDIESGERLGAESPGGSSDELEEMLMDKTQVPVYLVFGILLIYIALGACLFAVLEGWGWLDAFYFCFITLTTVGFGDLVPEQHAYIILMLLYIGVGLAVTTMCIDLVGIQYIQKIHYFGRKFKGADLLAMLKRKRALQHQMALAQQEGLFHMYMQDQPT